MKSHMRPGTGQCTHGTWHMDDVYIVPYGVKEARGGSDSSGGNLTLETDEMTHEEVHLGIPEPSSASDLPLRDQASIKYSSIKPVSRLPLTKWKCWSTSL